MNENAEFVWPMDCLAGVAEVFGGQYPMHLLSDFEPGLILDIGANVGAFALLCIQRWPKAVVECYEPEPKLFDYLMLNTCRQGGNVRCHQAAVGPGATGMLFPGKENRLCGSLYNLGRQNMERGFWVKMVAPESLPQADLVKIDTEGAEGDIVAGLLEGGRMPRVLMVEWHSESLRKRVDYLADRGGMVLVHAAVFQPGWGVNYYGKI